MDGDLPTHRDRYNVAVYGDEVHGDKVAGNKIVLVHHPQPTGPIFANVPARPNLLVGREALLADLVQRLIAGDSPALSSEGLPGVGKTTLAIAIAYEPAVRAHFTDGVLWASLGTQPDAASLLAQWGQALGLDLSGVLEEADRAQAVRNAIGQRAFLIVIDDAWASAPAHLLRVGGPGCRHLLTTRDRAVAAAFATAAQTWHVPALEPDPAWELLERLAPEACAADPRQARALAGTVGGLPLALELLGGYLAAPEHSQFPELSQAALAELDDPARRLQLACQRLGARPDISVTLQDTIALSLSGLPAVAAQAFHALGAFVYKPARFTLEAARAVTQAETTTLALLVSRNLVEQEGQWLTMHQCLSEAARSSLAPEAVVRYAHYYTDLALKQGATQFTNSNRVHVISAYSHQCDIAPREAARFFREMWLGDKDVPFLAITPLIDEIAHRQVASCDELAKAVAEVLTARSDAYGYFFAANPHGSWAAVLHETGMLREPPLTEQHFETPVYAQWPASKFLCRVAADAPDVVLRVVSEIDTENVTVLDDLAGALCRIPASEAATVVSHVIDWIEGNRFKNGLVDSVPRLVRVLIDGVQPTAALSLLHVCLLPAPPEISSVGQYRLVTVSSRFVYYRLDETFDDLIHHVFGKLPVQASELIEQALIALLQAEFSAEQGYDLETTSFWREAIASTAEHERQEYKHRLLSVLRDGLVKWAETGDAAFVSHVTDLNQSPYRILRRLAVYLMSRFPEQFVADVAAILQTKVGLDGSGMYYETISLLRSGYPLLNSEQQRVVLDTITAGPSDESIAAWRKLRGGVETADITRLVQEHIRDRLWLVQSHLPESHLAILRELVQKLGPPDPASLEPPSPLEMTELGPELSPTTAQDWGNKPITEFLDFLTEWQPSEPRRVTRDVPSMAGLAITVREMVLAQPDQFLDVVDAIVSRRINSAYLSAIVESLTEVIKSERSIDWVHTLRLCWHIALSTLPEPANHLELVADAAECRLNLARLLHMSLNVEAVPIEHLDAVKEIAIALIGTPGSQHAGDIEANNVLPGADLNMTGSRSLIVLLLVVSRQKSESRIVQMPGDVSNVIEKLLDPQIEHALVFRATIGQYFNVLWHVDSEWTGHHFGRIFPTGADRESERLFLAAFNSYIAFSKPWAVSFPYLRPIYQHGIALHQSEVNASLNHESDERLMRHLLAGFLNGWDSFETGHIGDENHLLNAVLQTNKPHLLKQFAASVWRAIYECPGSSRKRQAWSLLKPVVEHRLRQLWSNGCPSEFDDEVGQYALLPKALGDAETMAGWQPLLDRMLPHIARSQPPHFRYQLEEYLASHASQAPLLAVRCLRRLLYEFGQANGRKWYDRQSIQTILTTALEMSDESRGEALQLIDLMARHGDLSYKDLYDKYAF